MALFVNHNLASANVANNLGAHYARLASSTQRLSTGLRINSAADDAAGLAIRELQRADIAALNQGVRNANDAISLIQTADGALGVIDEKLIRLMELAEQASTGTYDSTQRIMINSEFQEMKKEIDRIAHATDFNGIKLLTGEMLINPDGPTYAQSEVTNTGFTGKASFAGNGNGHQPVLLEPQDWNAFTETTISIRVREDDINHDRNEEHYVNYNDNHISIWRTKVSTSAPDEIIFKIGRNEVRLPYDLNDRGKEVMWTMSVDANNFTVYKNGAQIWQEPATNPPMASTTANPNLSGLGGHWWDNGLSSSARFQGEMSDFHVYTKGLSADDIQHIYKKDVATDAPGLLIHFGPGNDSAEDYYYINIPAATTEGLGIAGVSVDTQEGAQHALAFVKHAILRKDEIRAHLGALQNRFENTVSNLTIQEQNLQAAESRISDVDVASEMTNFVRNQVLSNAAVAMLAQANSLPQMAMQLISR